MRKPSVICLGIALLLPLAITSLAPAETQDVKADDPVSQLTKIDLYAFGGIGFAGTISRGETLYHVILNRPTATADFLRIFKKGTPEARMYALHALARLSPDDYEKLKKSARANEKVSFMQGCIAAEFTMGDLIGDIDEKISQKGTE